jgi:hypothetical protein
MHSGSGTSGGCPALPRPEEAGGEAASSLGTDPVAVADALGLSRQQDARQPG